MFDLIIKNLFTLYLGASIRYIWLRIILRKKLSFKEVLNGVENKKAKHHEKELDNMREEFINKIVGFIFIAFIILILVWLAGKGY